MAFKMRGFSAFTKTDPPKKEKEIKVYRKGFKKYVAETDLEHEPTGKFQQITRKGKRKLKKEGSYVSGRKYKKIKDDYESGKYAKDQHEKRNKKSGRYTKEDRKFLKEQRESRVRKRHTK